ncbi:hypothetical protein PENCOP_c001G08190 [Penicillium coprophilum]|uniref:Uncharacterized protein n=1 Tax=Penicillium coprophilum TaxID=36646 RepID=A0A1V6VA36_9EURO|nr:hypothetical protein PENCOP_c001G08190 [Penicillium coprophilum]
MEKDPFTWVDVEDHKDGHRMNKWNELDILRRLENLKEEVSSFRQEKPIDREDHSLIPKLEILDEEDSLRQSVSESVGWLNKQPSILGQKKKSIKRNDLTLIQRRTDLQKEVDRRISIKREDPSIIRRIAGFEDAVENLIQKKSKVKKKTYAYRESVLNSWIQGPSSTIGGIKNTVYEGDIHADIQAIIAKEETDPETAERWKVVFLDRHGLQLGGGVDCGKGNELKLVHVEVIRFFNIGAQFLHGWGETHTKILGICDHWIGRWRSGRVIYIPSEEYYQLCQLYYCGTWV